MLLAILFVVVWFLLLIKQHNQKLGEERIQFNIYHKAKSGQKFKEGTWRKDLKLWRSVAYWFALWLAQPDFYI